MKNYNEDKKFLEPYMKLVELKDGDKRVLATPSLQGRVLTSSAEGEKGESFGWLNYKLISSGTILPHCNNWGGEDRFWLGPEGGQFAIFFKKGTDFDFEDWQAPALIDTAEWKMVYADSKKATFSTTETLTNCSGNKLECKLDREVEILNNSQIEKIIDAPLPHGLSVVGYKSSNTLTNIGSKAWDKESGGLSIWILGQFKPGDNNEVIIPTKKSDSDTMNDIYFGKVDLDRLYEDNGTYYFKGDGNKRGKIGTPPSMTIPTVFALDKDKEVLTIVKFSFEEDATDYINSLWQYQDEPFKGDVINAYNDGPLEDGTVMGGFYEIETSSKALLLKPEEPHTHTSTTIHITGAISKLEMFMNALKAAL